MNAQSPNDDEAKLDAHLSAMVKRGELETDDEGKTFKLTEKGLQKAKEMMIAAGINPDEMNELTLSELMVKVFGDQELDLDWPPH